VLTTRHSEHTPSWTNYINISEACTLIFQAATSIKIKGVHIISSSAYVDKFVAILKQGLREKVAGRLHVHSSYEDLHKHIPKEIIPVDYGGEEISCDSIAGNLLI
jgi:hypothetical protein